MTLGKMYTFKFTRFSEIGINALIAGFIKRICDIFSYPNVFGLKSDYFRYGGIILAKPPKNHIQFTPERFIFHIIKTAETFN